VQRESPSTRDGPTRDRLGIGLPVGPVSTKGGAGYAPRVSADVLFVVDPLPALSPRADSTYVMITEALRRGHRPFAVTLEGLSSAAEITYAHAVPINVDGPGAPVLQRGDAERRPLGSFDVVCMRKDPPFDDNYLVATWLLERARGQTLLINDPQGLRDLNEKLAILAFPHLTPATRIVRTRADLHATLAEFGGRMIVKPIFGFGGRAVLQARDDDPNLNALFELATQEGSTWTVAQAFVEAAKIGDKRILLVDGAPVGAVLRVPAQGEGRSNFHVGGSAAPTELDDNDRRICAAVGPYLRARGQFFVGIDVIGGKLTEINVTSPTGMQEINALGSLSENDTMQARFWGGIEAKLDAGVTQVEG